MYTTLLWIIFVILLIIPSVLFIVQRYNYYKYIETPRSAEEISKWLRKQKFFDAYKRNVELGFQAGGIEDMDLHGTANDYINEYLNGKLGKSTISSAFFWSQTEEGVEYWANAEYKFLRWYYKQYVDFHLIKSF